MSSNRDSIDILSTVASAAGPLPVRQATDGMAIEQGNVYLAAPTIISF